MIIVGNISSGTGVPPQLTVDKSVNAGTLDTAVSV